MTQVGERAGGGTRRTPEVTIGSTWFIWGEHQLVAKERTGHTVVDGRREREVKLVPADKPAQKGAFYPYVADWRVAKFGVPSHYYNNQKEEQMAEVATKARAKAQPKKAKQRKAAAKTPAADLHEQVKKASTRDVIVQVLTRARGPLAHAILMERVLAVKQVPEKTVRGELSREAALTDGRIVRVEKGVYDLRSRAKKGARV